MNLETQIANCRYDVTIENAVSIAIPLYFNELQPVNYGVAFAQSEPCITGNFIGDVRQGGSCNFEKYTLIPHCNGTHTECYGHLTEQRTSVHDLITVVLVPCTLISILPSESSKVIESYNPQPEKNDLIISRSLLEEKLKDSTSGFFNSLVIRTMPNSIEKKTRNYDSIQAPYFSNEAMHFLNELGVMHLLVDFPSVSDDALRNPIFDSLPESKNSGSVILYILFSSSSLPAMFHFPSLLLLIFFNCR